MIRWCPSGPDRVKGTSGQASKAGSSSDTLPGDAPCDPGVQSRR
jgi:hypothetical protein